nr:peptidase S8 [bacterium]
MMYLRCFTLCACAVALFAGGVAAFTPGDLSEMAVTEQDGSFFVVLKARADLSAARDKVTKAEKGRYVFEALTRTAEESQAPIRQILDARGVTYKSYWIQNM